MTRRVVVAGGGPSGLAAAVVLARSGVDVHVCEAGTYGGPRMCGEFLSPDAAAALREIGADRALDGLGAPRIAAVRITLADAGRAERRHGFRLAASGRGVGRTELDPLLAACARASGATVEERCRVVRAGVDAGARVRVETTRGAVDADALVLATGRTAAPGDAPARRGPWVAVRTHVRGIRVPERTDLHFVRGAYVGLNEVASRGERVVNVCALIGRRVWNAAGRTPAGVWEHLARESPSFAEQWRRARPLHGTDRTAAGFGFALRGARGHGDRPALRVGDAAALIAPLCGDGQAMALTGGVAAARALAAEASLDAAAVRRAAARWHQTFRRDFRVRLRSGLLLQRALLWPPAARTLLAAARTVRPAGNWMYRATRGAV